MTITALQVATAERADALVLELTGVGLTLLGTGATLAQLFGPSAFVDDINDSPIYSASDPSSPTLKVVTTATSFELFFTQPNLISEFEDDQVGGLKGSVQTRIGNNDVHTWDFLINFEAEVVDNLIFGDPDYNSLTASGFVQHHYAPHPKDGDATGGGAILNYNIFTGQLDEDLAQTQLSYQQQPLPRGKHEASDDHFDVMSFATLQVRCCNTEIRNFSFHMKAVHLSAVPLPPTAAMLLASMGGLAAYRLRKRVAARAGSA